VVGISTWVAGARPRTLPAAIVPVAVGTGVAASFEEVVWWRVGAAAVVALAIQVGTNYANDYSDGIRGTDDARVGPVRLVGQGLAAPRAVKRAAIGAFSVAAVAGLVLAAVAGWWLILVGAACIAAGWLYTGGPRPYGYLGLGEVFVFVFFGLVATAGTAYVNMERLTGLAVAASVPVGLLAVALLVTNNLRDLPSDEASGKRTLAVRLGDPATRHLYTAIIVAVFVSGAVVAIMRTPALLTLLAAPLAWTTTLPVRRGATGPALVPVLVATSRLQLTYGALLTMGLVVSGVS
jgi:1,4-dihydroxy-2-naphthoate octaprenyltransferase